MLLLGVVKKAFGGGEAKVSNESRGARGAYTEKKTYT